MDIADRKAIWEQVLEGQRRGKMYCPPSPNLEDSVIESSFII
jgi:hypothetical protein